MKISKRASFLVMSLTAIAIVNAQIAFAGNPINGNEPKGDPTKPITAQNSCALDYDAAIDRNHYIQLGGKVGIFGSIFVALINPVAGAISFTGSFVSTAVAQQREQNRAEAFLVLSQARRERMKQNHKKTPEELNEFVEHVQKNAHRKNRKKPVPTREEIIVALTNADAERTYCQPSTSKITPNIPKLYSLKSMRKDVLASILEEEKPKIADADLIQDDVFESVAEAQQAEENLKHVPSAEDEEEAAEVTSAALAH